MYYTKTITIPSNTTRINPKTDFLRVWRGIITRVEILFPLGCALLAHAQIWIGGQQIIPSIEMQDIAGDNETVPVRTFVRLIPALNILTIKTWNVDDTYDHTLQFRFTILPEEVAAPQYYFREMHRVLNKLMRRIGVISEEKW